MKKVYILLVMVFLISLLGGCKNKKIEPTYIETNEIFSFEGKYYVYFYGEKCTSCVETTKELKKLINKKKIECYFFDTKNLSKANIYSVGPGEEPYSNLGVSLIKDMKITFTPTLLYIEDGVIRGQYVNRNVIMAHLNKL